MPHYRYVATDKDGRVIKGIERADAPAILLEGLKEQGMYLAKFEEEAYKPPRARYRFKTKKLAIFCRQLGAMLDSGVTVVRALHILTTQEVDNRAKKVLRELYEELQRGHSFSEALLTRPGVFPDLFVSMVAAGESSGSLDRIMDRVADHYQKEAKLNNKIRGAMIYPIILGVLTIGVVLLLFTFILPMFMELFTNPDDIPILTRILMSISTFITTRWYVLIIVVVGAILLIRFLLSVPEIRARFDRLKVRAPKIGPLFVTIYTARFARTMSNLFASGMQMVECLEKSVGTLNNFYIERCFVNVLEAVKRGESLSESIAKENVFEPMFTSTVYIGEESGRLDEILQKSADYYDDEADSAIQRLVSMLEPVMIIIMGLSVGLVLAGIFPAMYASFAGIAANG